MLKRFLVTILFFNIFVFSSKGQTTLIPVSNGQVNLTGADPNAPNIITTAVPFLTISPDARSGAMGDVGAAISPDANSIYWNAAKLAFAEKDMGFSLSYTPWLRKLGINDMFISQLSGYKRLSKQETIGVGLTYFNLGSIQFTDAVGNPGLNYQPREFAFSATYARKLSEKFSMSILGRFIYSNLTGSAQLSSGTQTGPGVTAAADIGFFYKTPLMISGLPASLSLGANLSNIGGKIKYTTGTSQSGDFIPANLRIGGALNLEIDQYNRIVFALDANKLLVPTPPLIGRDSAGTQYIVAGKDSRNESSIGAIFSSFTDAPGGLKEELSEINLCGGVEYWYNNLFSVRGGYYNEAQTKGNRKYFTLGVGIRYQTFGLDVAYLIPMAQNNPLAETLRFTLHFDFDAKKKQEDITTE